MMRRFLDRLRGPEHIRHRADRFFLAGEFDRARFEYERARALLRADDFRRGALDSLIGSCERLSRSEERADAQAASTARAVERAVSTVVDRGPRGAQAHVDTDVGVDDFVPGLDDFFELAIADKPAPRAEDYRMQDKRFRAGYVALIQGTAERAVRLLKDAAAESPKAFVVQLELGRALSMSEKFEEARDALRAAERSRPGDREAIVLLAAIHIELGRFDDARGSLEALVAAGPREPEILFLLGKALSGAGRDEDALARLKETAELEPRFHEAFYEAGCIRRRHGETEAAFDLLNRAAALAPDEVTYNRAVAELVLEQELDVEAGLAACDRLMVTDEDNRWQYLSWIADLYLRRGWRREARDPLEKALDLVPADRKAERIAIEHRLGLLDG